MKIENSNLETGPARRGPSVAHEMQDPPALTANALKVLRLVRASDPFRDKGRGAQGRSARLRQLDALRELGLTRTTREGLWRLTGRGKQVLLVNPLKR